MPENLVSIHLKRGILQQRTFITAIVQVDEILLVLLGKSSGINSISVVLGGDMALAGCQIQGWNVVGSVSVLELDGTCTCCKSKQLVTEANTHDWDLGRFHQSAQVVDGLLAVSWVTRAIRDENTVEVVSNLVDGEIVISPGKMRNNI